MVTLVAVCEPLDGGLPDPAAQLLTLDPDLDADRVRDHRKTWRTQRTSASPAREQPLLGIVDAVAWCNQKGADWPTKVAPILSEAIRVEPP